MDWNSHEIDELIRRALAEDVGSGDVTSLATIPATAIAHARIIAKAPLVCAGLPLAGNVFRSLDADASVKLLANDGDLVEKGCEVLKIRARARAVLTAERTALNFLAHLSGVATLTRQFVRAVKGTSAEILDTRKTTPGLRDLEKYAVRAGGGRNHRRDLSEAVLIKENHIRLAGGVSAALTAAQTAKGRAAWMEIEVTNLDELGAALAYNPDVVLLDNMNPALVCQAVQQVRTHDPARKIRTEASGGITLANVREFAEAGVDWISVGALTHSAPAVDLSFEIEPA